MAVTAFSNVEHFYVVEDISTCLISGSIDLFSYSREMAERYSVEVARIHEISGVLKSVRTTSQTPGLHFHAAIAKLACCLHDSGQEGERDSKILDWRGDQTMKRTISLLAGLTLATGIAIAAGDMKDEKTFSELDTNGDGYLSQSEVVTDPSDKKMKENFALADVDQNGNLSQKEYRNMATFHERDRSKDTE